MEWVNKLDAAKKRWLALGLAFAAFCMMWGNWVTLQREHRENWKEEFARAESFGGMAEELISGFEAYDIPLKRAEAKKIANTFRDGGLSIAEGRLVLSKIADLGRSIEDSEYGYWLLDQESMKIISSLKSINIFYQLLFWLTVFAGGWTVICRLLTRKDVVDKVSTALFFLWSMVSLMAVIRVNEMADTSLLRITLWSVLAPLSSLASSILWSRCIEELKEKNTGLFDPEGVGRGVEAIKEKGTALFHQSKHAIRAAVVLQKPWACPLCGAQMEAGKKFCSACGAKRPEPLRCAACGAVQEAGVEFCADCGAKFVPQRSCKTCGVPLKENDHFCAKCGAEYREEEQTIG